ncbi:hypothetical protein MLD38_032862 [Melastoma candidum]|uniref:Uncharacterized protein n=1 Tax=Melastoma candidum TaxID=119954 RepID=A0ACB9M5G7_9MYRT|nr:hypothetical protein MLD38_032862 [Melastoma candidum]
MLAQYDGDGVGIEEASGEEVKCRAGIAEGRLMEEEIGQGGGEEAEVDDDGGGGGAGENDALKRRISSHPLYNKLVEIHLDCLKVSGVANLDTTFQITTPKQQHQSEPDQTFPDHFSDLDQFMEAYCLALSQLREAMEEPQEETVTFIDDMHSQLQEIIATQPEEQPQASPSPFSGKQASNMRRDPPFEDRRFVV